jgi:hypothetical protein
VRICQVGRKVVEIDPVVSTELYSAKQGGRPVFEMLGDVVTPKLVTT